MVSQRPGKTKRWKKQFLGDDEDDDFEDAATEKFYQDNDQSEDEEDMPDDFQEKEQDVKSIEEKGNVDDKSMDGESMNENVESRENSGETSMEKIPQVYPGSKKAKYIDEKNNAFSSTSQSVEEFFAIVETRKKRQFAKTVRKNKHLYKRPNKII